ncbi:unnamed protein product [Gongylonema pulchrum]|uniref:Zgc: n=1 Tax=Gongylonema pulchrum TaxID=637853 RepID=A0A183DT62_9BILA|nr:unnamed protein product [Gongylonema pulchrum]
MWLVKRSAASSAQIGWEPTFISYSQWDIPDNRHVQPENPTGYARFGNSLQTLWKFFTENPTGNSFVFQKNPADYQALSQAPPPAVLPAQQPESDLLSLQKCVAKRLSRFRDLQTIQDCTEREEEFSVRPGKSITPQLRRRDPRVHGFSPDVSMPLLREILRRPPLAEPTLSQMQKNLLDSTFATQRKPMLVDLTSENENYWPTVIDASRAQGNGGQECTEATCPGFRVSTNYDKRGKIREQGYSKSSGGSTESYDTEHSLCYVTRALDSQNQRRASGHFDHWENRFGYLESNNPTNFHGQNVPNSRSVVNRRIQPLSNEQAPIHTEFRSQLNSRGCISPEWTPETARYLDSLLSVNWEGTDNSSSSGQVLELSVQPLASKIQNVRHVPVEPQLPSSSICFPGKAPPTLQSWQGLQPADQKSKLPSFQRLKDSLSRSSISQVIFFLSNYFFEERWDFQLVRLKCMAVQSGEIL